MAIFAVWLAMLAAPKNLSDMSDIMSTFSSFVIFALTVVAMTVIVGNSKLLSN
jgi:hypothetical protein